jgi:LysM repeat protein
MFGVYARRRISALGALLLVLVLGWHVTEAHTAPSNDAPAAVRAAQAPAPTRALLVAPGDTLWSIVEQYGNGDPREDVDTLSRLNHLHGGQIQAGQELRLPLFF